MCKMSFVSLAGLEVDSAWDIFTQLRNFLTLAAEQVGRSEGGAGGRAIRFSKIFSCFLLPGSQPSYFAFKKT